MHIARATWPSANGNSYQSLYLRESLRDGNHVRKRNIANLTRCDPLEIAAIELALNSRAIWLPWAHSTRSSCPKVSRWEPCGPSLKSPGVSASATRPAMISPANWRCGRSSPVSWTRDRGCRLCARSKLMGLAMCLESGGSSMKTISTPISPGYPVNANDRVILVNKQGAYRFAHLEPGEYRIASEDVGVASALTLTMETGKAYYFLQ